MKRLSILTISVILTSSILASENNFVSFSLNQLQDIQTYDEDIITKYDLLDGYA